MSWVFRGFFRVFFDFQRGSFWIIQTHRVTFYLRRLGVYRVFLGKWVVRRFWLKLRDVPEWIKRSTYLVFYYSSWEARSTASRSMEWTCLLSRSEFCLANFCYFFWVREKVRDLIGGEGCWVVSHRGVGSTWRVDGGSSRVIWWGVWYWSRLIGRFWIPCFF